MRKHLYFGRNPLHLQAGPVRGEQVALEGETYYRVLNYDRLRPFFLSLVSSGDLWLFISSTGALTAGRRHPDLALFPYYPEDKIHDAADSTGSQTVLWARQGRRQYLWEPFSSRAAGVYRVRRTLYKNTWGNKLVFEETNEDLALRFRYGWFNSEQFGFVRRAWLTNTSQAVVRVRLLDGLQNLMPWGVGGQFQLDKSNLLDAYKRNELLRPSGLALFRLSSIPIDRPEPAEALKATTVFGIGLPGALRLLSTSQVERFRRGESVHEETDVRAERGAYLLQSELRLGGGETAGWLLAADVGRGAVEVVALREALRRPARLRRLVLAEIERDTDELRRLVASADGLQQTACPLRDARHYHNALFNVMRGGVFGEGYRIDPTDLRAFVSNADRRLGASQTAFFDNLGAGASYAQMVAAAVKTGNRQLERLCREYLPLTFSRRHGDPSRPWNRFAIASRAADGRRVLHYEGNWRDLFQNWEALAVSFPGYLPGMVCRFVSASTADGYNPYRITRDGIDWEVINPADPWAHIGYWGDHQLIYLLKLLELLRAHDPATLQDFLTRDLFAYANVPYRLRPYADLVRNPKETVDFDAAAEETVRGRVQARGADGKLLWDDQGQVRLVTLTEKLLVAVLAKLANFIPEVGIWMNTQRPEWNDANNALVGYGVSMVTLCYLRRYLVFVREVLSPFAHTPLRLSREVSQWLSQTHQDLERYRPLLSARLNAGQRRRALDAWGTAGSRYRQRLYTAGLTGRRAEVRGEQVREFCALALEWADHTIHANCRSDGLYHAYNLIRTDQARTLPVRRLYEMLEGQVAVLSSGALSARESVALLAALRRSAMYRPDQRSYLLYPNRALPRFLDRNLIPAAAVSRSPLLLRLMADGDRTLVERDMLGHYHFNGEFQNANDVGRALDALAARGYARLVKSESPKVLALFDRLFDHQSFTGRSGTFFGYEGLGCIYWHMVSKLRLAVLETCQRATLAEADASPRRQLARQYYDIRDGLGEAKTPAVYGAFPVDPYSHTPAQAGARQPGLTGQVKEDILCRFGELGVVVREGQVSFRPRLLRAGEFLAEAATFHYYDVAGQARALRLPAGSLAFTYCQVPIVYRRADRSAVVVWRRDGSRVRSDGLALDAATSRSLFSRAGEVARVEVSMRVVPLQGRQRVR